MIGRDFSCHHWDTLEHPSKAKSAIQPIRGVIALLGVHRDYAGSSRLAVCQRVGQERAADPLSSKGRMYRQTINLA